MDGRFICLSGQAASVAESLRLDEWSLSLSHAEHYAVAIAIAVRQRAGVTSEGALCLPDAPDICLEPPLNSDALFERWEYNEREQSKGDQDE